jgi:serine/threonine protein kinase
MPTEAEEAGSNKRLGDFHIVREVGRGGMGIVYEARQVSLKRRVALKVLAAGLGQSARAVERFHREAEAAARLHHSNIVPVYATGEQDGSHFYAMELIEGPSLDQVLKQLKQTKSDRETADAATSTPSELGQTGPYVQSGATGASNELTSSSLGWGSGYFDRVARLLAGVADALEYAHRQGVIHRDIKPSNLLLSAEGRLCVNDFGLARLLEQPGMTMTGEFVGTPAYMSPEQITAGRIPIDHRTDIYSLGATLYEMLTLQPPFVGASRDQVLAQIIQKEPPRPRKINPKVPIDLETICLKCLEKDPDRRYRSAGDLAEDLRCFVNRFAIRARRAGLLTRLGKWVKRNPALAAAAAVVLVSLGAAGFFAWRARQAEQDRVAAIREEQRKTALENAVSAALNGQYDRADQHIAEAEDLDVALGEVSKVRGIIALYRNDQAGALTHLTKAAERLGSSVAVKALLARAYIESGDRNHDSLIAELGPLVPHTPEDYLFKGQIICHFDDPRVGLELIEQAIKLRPSPLARLALAEARVLVAFDSGLDKDAEEAVEDATFAHKQLPTSVLALAACIQARLILWDICKDRAGGRDKTRVAQQWAAAGKLVEAAGLRASNALQIGCQYYHDRRGDGRSHAKAVWEATRKPSAGELYARELYRSADHQEARKVIVETRKRRGSLGLPEWFVWSCLQAHEGRVEAVYQEGLVGPRTPGFVLSFPTVALLLNKPAEASKLSSEALKQGIVPRWHNGWYEALAQYGAGKGGPNAEDALLSRAGKSRMNQCEAQFHIALHYLGRGRKQRARVHLEKVVKTRVFTYVEHELAGVFLDRMKDDRDWPPWIPTKEK